MKKRTPKLSLRGLRTFCAAARNESFRLAADELFITASAVSHQIKSLEKELGRTLFERNSRSLKLTDTGRAMFEEACPLMTQLDALAGKYRATDTRRSLRISVQPFFASEMFVPRLNEFTERYPELDLTVDTSDETSEKLPANADVAIRLFKSPPDNAEFLFPLKLLPVGSPEFRDSVVVEKKRIKSRFPIIVHETRANAWQQWARVTGIKLPDNSNAIRLDSMIAVARAAQRGVGAALVPVALSDRWLESGSLVPIFEDELDSEDGYYLICREDKSGDRDVEVLRDWVLQNFDDTR